MFEYEMTLFGETSLKTLDILSRYRQTEHNFGCVEKLMLLKCLVSLFVCCAFLRAADPTGTISGIIQDPSGAAVANARVTATAIATGLTRETVSANSGAFLFPLLPSGRYSIAAQAAGFERYEQRGIEVKTDQNATVAFTLKIGSSTQSVTVEANAQMIETRSGALSQVITQQKIVDLPLNGRNYLQLASMIPGATTNGPASSQGPGRMGGTRNEFALNV
ncbi:MAG: carboxypeptidase-like regulatory domain-containing protein, partial [Thermoanaerobaculia bacterium]